MVKDKYLEYISVFWKEGKISTDECTQRIYDFFKILKNHNEALFNSWYEQGIRKKEVLEKQIEFNLDTISEMVKKNWDKKNEHLGTSFALWTGHQEEGESASINFRLGAYGEKPHIKSGCVISFPYSGDQIDFYQNEKNRNEIIELIQNHWNPDKIIVHEEDIVD